MYLKLASVTPYNIHKWMVKFHPRAGFISSIVSVPECYLLATLSSRLSHLYLPCHFISLLHLQCLFLPCPSLVYPLPLSPLL